ncbi:MAG: MerR family transcriptional regulator [Flavobacteriales bacterium]|nr:MerR family transcriptional regulator [Flavobacteriales bacterium]
MPYKEKEIAKLYYTMGDVSSMLNVNHSLIRFWEKEFDVLKPKKNKKGNRLFTPKDVENLKLIYHLVKERGYTLEGARKKIKGNPDEVEHTMEIVDKLKGIKAYLLELKEYL